MELSLIAASNKRIDILKAIVTKFITFSKQIMIMHIHGIFAGWGLSAKCLAEGASIMSRISTAQTNV